MKCAYRFLVYASTLLCTTYLFGASPEMKAHFIDVGQGASALLEFPCGAVLIDTGGQDSEHSEHLKAFLTDFFHRRTDLKDTLAALFITHPHIDHTRGIRAVTELCHVVNYIDDGITQGSGGRQVQWIRDQVESGKLKTHIREISDDEITALPEKKGLTDRDIDSLKCDDCDPSIVMLSGSMPTNPGWSSKEFKNWNNHSLVIRVDFGKASFLFTGDMEAPAIQTLVSYYRNTKMLDVDVYHIGHHGSHNGTTRALLEAATPEIAVMGVGRWDFGKNDSNPFTTWRFGHPRAVVIDLLNEFITGRRSKPVDTMAFDGPRDPIDYTIRKKIYATGWDGDVTITATLDGKMRVTSHPSLDVTPTDEMVAPRLAAVKTLSELKQRESDAPPYDCGTDEEDEPIRNRRRSAARDRTQEPTLTPHATAVIDE